MKRIVFLITLFSLNACFSGAIEFEKPTTPEMWKAKNKESKIVEPESLKNWWERFEDESLNNLVVAALKHNPDRLTAQARILEARGLRKAARSFLLPSLSASASGGRQHTGISGDATDNFYDAGFDAAYELDLFGKNRKNLSAADARIEEAEAYYNDTTLSLIAEITRAYIDLRAAQNHLRIATKNLVSQEKTLALIEELNRLGSAPQLDVERSSNLVNTTKASIPEFKRLTENARLRLSMLVGVLPDHELVQIDKEAEIPNAELAIILLTPANVLSLRPDIQVASANLSANTALAESATAEFFPAFTLGGFYGVSDGAFVNSATVWNVALGAAVSLLDFGRISGNIDAARAREIQAFELYRKAVITAVTEVEMALTDYAHIHQRYLSLEQAFQSAEKALGFSESLYKEGEVSFLDVLDAQRSANNAEASMIEAKAAKSETLVRLFKALGVY
jgi:NodT family efflux transporter outer membrane factor (OMF) lipoprotein